MLPFILGGALGAAMVSSNKSIAKKVEIKGGGSLPDLDKSPIDPIVEEPIIAEPIVTNPATQEPIKDSPIVSLPIGLKPVTLEGITQDFLDAITSTSTTTKTGKVIVGELDKGSFGERIKKGKIYVAPLDKGEFVPDPPKKTGKVIVMPLDKGSFDKPKVRKGTVMAMPIENYGKWVESQVVRGNMIILPQITVTNPKVKSVKILVEPLKVGEKDDWEARTAENPLPSTSGSSGGGYSGGDASGGFSGGGFSGGGLGWNSLNSWIFAASINNTPQRTGTVIVEYGKGEIVEQQ